MNKTLEESKCLASLAVFRELWNVVDIVWAILLITSIIANKEIRISK